MKSKPYQTRPRPHLLLRFWLGGFSSWEDPETFFGVRSSEDSDRRESLGFRLQGRGRERKRALAPHLVEREREGETERAMYT